MSDHPREESPDMAAGSGSESGEGGSTKGGGKKDDKGKKSHRRPSLKNRRPVTATEDEPVEETPTVPRSQTKEEPPKEEDPKPEPPKPSDPPESGPVIDAELAPGSESDVPATSEPPPESEEARRGPITLKVFGRTDVGQIREHNEDNFLIADLENKVRGVAGSAKTIELKTGGVLLAVCDGMGGAAAGEVASKLATDIVYERMLARAGHHKREQLALDIVEALEVAGTRILMESNNNRACRGMGTTATVAALVDDCLLLGQVGDSRAYVLRGDRLVQVTRDQSLVNQLIEAGQLTEEEAENFEHSNIILQALGTAEAVQVDLTMVELHRGDVLLMCSDGLSGMIRDAEISETLTNVPDPLEACRVLIDDANQAGGHDNITVIVAVFDGEGLKEAEIDDVEALKYQKYALPAWAMERAAKAMRSISFDDEDTYDSTPSIEITGEFEVDADTDWKDVLDERSRIPKDTGPNLSSVFMWIALIGLVIALYFLIFAR
ncbi:MAG TPA: Stp1/IreP family PP2C-type Ser/Thr phosphatase [Polyangiaceae bacterium]|nr:Stp1/IreP family PP2C-type Ser/Thr phosphatase [Polyangiaceae bacterium]